MIDTLSNDAGTTLLHNVFPPSQHSQQPAPAVILLHGRGSDEHDLPGLLSFLDPRLFGISVRAPFPFEYGSGFTWYDILEVGKPEPVMFKESCERLERFVEQVKQTYPIDPSRIILFGFSMGSIMSFAHALSHPETVWGVAANSGYIAEGTHLQYRWNDLRKLLVFVSHGIHDPVIPVAMARRTKELLDRSKAVVTYREYPMGHQIGEENLGDLAAWLSGVIDS